MNMLQKRDMILAAAIPSATVAALDISYYTRRALATIVQVSPDGTVVKTPDPSKDIEITVILPNGGTSHLIVKDGRIWCSEVSRPDKACVHQGKKYLNNDTVVCLPNQMIVTITGGE